MPTQKQAIRQASTVYVVVHTENEYLLVAITKDRARWLIDKDGAGITIAIDRTDNSVCFEARGYMSDDPVMYRN